MFCFLSCLCSMVISVLQCLHQTQILHLLQYEFEDNRFGYINPLPTKVANMQLLDPLCFVCTLEQNRPTHGDVPRQGHKTCFFAKKWVCFRAASPTKSVKSAPKWRQNFYFFQFLSFFYDFLTPCDLLGVVWKTPWGLSLPKIRQVPA